MIVKRFVLYLRLEKKFFITVDILKGLKSKNKQDKNVRTREF